MSGLSVMVSFLTSLHTSFILSSQPRPVSPVRAKMNPAAGALFSSQPPLTSDLPLLPKHSFPTRRSGQMSVKVQHCSLLAVMTVALVLGFKQLILKGAETISKHSNNGRAPMQGRKTAHLGNCVWLRCFSLPCLPLPRSLSWMY